MCARWFDPRILFISLFIFLKKVARKRINLKFKAVRSSDVKRVSPVAASVGDWCLYHRADPHMLLAAEMGVHRILLSVQGYYKRMTLLVMTHHHIPPVV